MNELLIFILTGFSVVGLCYLIAFTIVKFLYNIVDGNNPLNNFWK